MSTKFNSFTCLQIESLSDSEEQTDKIEQHANAGDNQNVNHKKRARRKKKRQEKAEIRDIAFGKIPSVNCRPVAVQQQQPAVVLNSTTQNYSDHSDKSNPKQWDSWKKHDENLTEDQFSKDLQEALLQSQLEFEQQRKFLEEVKDVEDSLESQVNKKVKKKPQAMTLKEFQKPPEPSSTDLDKIHLPSQVEADPLFFQKVKADATRILNKEHVKKLKKGQEKKLSDNARRLQYEDNMEKKEQELLDLENGMEKLKEELTQVKKRNKQLCFILAQGEMKDKADVLKQVEELTTVKDELTEEVCQLHVFLEQERSKVSSLQSEIKKLQERKK
ncbi:G kinase-anchoring protein 1-like [Antedon mediterranea]|uniref:G kinase-anchoring protein 1-like n=1 Tax=Antedon mediterranea TaxID=105859 RepID=UPI003AF996B3